jgi:FKBP-type peptidyl-prolyl cis-trans isomerase
VVPVLLLTAACGSSNPTSTSSGSAGGLPKISAGAKFGQKPTVAKATGTAPTKLVTATTVVGTGATVKSGDFIGANYLGQIYGSGTVFDNSYDRGQPITTQIGTGAVIKGWDQALVGQKVGSRVEMSIPPSLAYGSTAQGTIPANSTLVFVVDITSAVTAPASAKGTVQPQNDASLPKVGTNTDGKAPSITVPSGPAPTKLVSNYIIQGTGKTLKSTDTVVVQYNGVLWQGGKQFDSSYSRGAPISFSLSQVVKGWSQGLTGKKVGSRVLLVVPPSLGYGSTAQTGIPANSTLVFSVDILAVF